MDWVPVVFIVFKAIVFSTAMCFAIKWHYDQGKSMEKRALVRGGIKVAAAFVLVLVGALVLTFALASALGADLRLP